MPEFHRLMSRGNPVTIEGRPYTSDNLCDITDEDRRRLAIIQIARMTDPDELRVVSAAAARQMMAIDHPQSDPGDEDDCVGGEGVS